MSKIPRDDAEKAILMKLKEIDEVWHSYDPNGTYLSMSISKVTDGMENESGSWDAMVFSANNAYWGQDKDTPIDVSQWFDIHNDKYDSCVHDDDEPSFHYYVGNRERKWE